MLTAEQRRLREFHFTASAAPTLMAGDEAELLKLWRVAIGEIPEEDLSRVWPVQLGSFLETFILDWHQEKTGLVLTERGRVVEHPKLPHVCATLDAFRAHDDCTLDVKVCNSWQALEDIVNRYTPQALVQKSCRRAARCSLLIMHGTAEPREIEVLADANYEKELWARIASFWLCVETLTPPVPLPKIVPPDQWRTVDLNADPKPNWGNPMISELRQWLETKEAADVNAHAASVAKSLVPQDVGCVRFSNVTVKRDRRGYLSLKVA
jgi:hypothetical protein